MYKFNPIYNKFPGGPSLEKKSVAYELKIAKTIGATAVDFVYTPDFTEDKVAIPMQIAKEDDVYQTYKVELKFESSGLYWYYFEVYQNEHKFYLQKTPDFEV